MSAPPKSRGEPITDLRSLVSHLEQGSKPASEWRIGTEHEKFAYRISDLRPLPYDGPDGISELLNRMTRFGWEPVTENGSVIDLLVQQSLVSPALTVDQVAALPAGVAQFLTERVNAISGLAVEADDLDKAVRAPLARACFILAREFGWTPNECAELTVGQILLYLEMLARDERPVAQS